jgi:hypothetical protein
MYYLIQDIIIIIQHIPTINFQFKYNTTLYNKNNLYYLLSKARQTWQRNVLQYLTKNWPLGPLGSPRFKNNINKQAIIMK